MDSVERELRGLDIDLELGVEEVEEVEEVEDFLGETGQQWMSVLPKGMSSSEDEEEEECGGGVEGGW